jgi:hypothetical protein
MALTISVGLQIGALVLTLLAAFVLSVDAFPRLLFVLAWISPRFGGLVAGIAVLSFPDLAKTYDKVDTEVEAALDRAARGTPNQVWILTKASDMFEPTLGPLKARLAILRRVEASVPDLSGATELWHVRSTQGVNIAGDLHLSDTMLLRTQDSQGKSRLINLGMRFEDYAELARDFQQKTLYRWSMWLLLLAAALQILSLGGWA